MSKVTNVYNYEVIDWAKMMDSDSEEEDLLETTSLIQDFSSSLRCSDDPVPSTNEIVSKSSQENKKPTNNGMSYASNKKMESNETSSLDSKDTTNSEIEIFNTHEIQLDLDSGLGISSGLDQTFSHGDESIQTIPITKSTIEKESQITPRHKRPLKKKSRCQSPASSTCSTERPRKAAKFQYQSHVQFETDPVVIQRRQKQIDYGKNTIGYQNYIGKIAKSKRCKTDIKTPNKYIKYSRRSWDQQIKLWRIRLHEFDSDFDKTSEKMNDTKQIANFELENEQELKVNRKLQFDQEINESQAPKKAQDSSFTDSTTLTTTSTEIDLDVDISDILDL